MGKVLKSRTKFLLVLKKLIYNNRWKIYKYIKTKLASVSVFCKSRCLKTANHNFIHYALPHPHPHILPNAVTIDPVTVKIANWLLIRQPEQ